MNDQARTHTGLWVWKESEKSMDWRQMLQSFVNAQPGTSDREIIERTRESLQGMLTDIQASIEGLNELRDVLQAALADTERLK